LTRLLIERNIDFEVSATYRSKIQFPEKNIKSYLFNSHDFDPEIKRSLKNATHILISTPPEVEQIIIKYFLSSLQKNQNLKWVGYLSSTSVYGDHEGDWVEETSSTKATSEMGLKRIEAEQLLLNSNLPIRIFRLAGIYSLERNVFLRLKKQEIKTISMKDQIFSRIHVEDIAQVLLSSYTKSKEKDINNVREEEQCS